MQMRTKEALQQVYTALPPLGFARRFPNIVDVKPDGKRWYPCVAVLPHEHQLVVEPFGGDWFVCAYHERGEEVDRHVLATSRQPGVGRAMRLQTAIAVAARLLAEFGAADDHVKVAHPDTRAIWATQGAMGMLDGG